MRLAASTSVAALLVFATPLHAGGWMSGGSGELTGDGANPWFLEIPEQVDLINYCIDADESAMGVELAKLEEFVRRAIAYWQAQIPAAHLPEGPAGTKVKVRTGPFRYLPRPCDERADITFQFGLISTKEQEQFIDQEKLSLTHFVGFAARLSYDQNLRGRGFIYIAPESGPLRPEGEHLLDHFWSEGPVRLLSVVTHELGHVFGVTHFGGAADLMGRDFPENVITDFIQSHVVAWSMRSIFRAGDALRFSRCWATAPSPALVAALGLAPNDRCLQLLLNGDGLIAHASLDTHSPQRLVSRFRIDESTVRERYHEVVRLWLPEQRAVFRDLAPGVKVLSGPSVVEMVATGTIDPTSPGIAPIPAMMTVDPMHLQLSVVLQQGLVSDVLEGAVSGWQKPE